MLDSKKGRLIVIEGLDGSGKATQASLLLEHLKKQNIPTEKFSFPNYDEPSSVLVKMYLNGEIGSLEEINAYAASSFYGVDRYVSWKKHLKAPYNSGKIIVLDRYTTSNMVHQTTKEPQERWDDFLSWLQDFEYVKLGLPKPDLVLYLDMNPNTAQKLIDARYNGDESQKDIHESNIQYLIQCRKAALHAAQKFEWEKINCCDGANLLTISEIHDEIWKRVEKFL